MPQKNHEQEILMVRQVLEHNRKYFKLPRWASQAQSLSKYFRRKEDHIEIDSR